MNAAVAESSRVRRMPPRQSGAAPTATRTRPQDDRLITREEARARLGGIGRTLLDQLLRQGVIASMKVGRRRLVSENSVAEFIRAKLADETT